jgi:hypothetical protein
MDTCARCHRPMDKNKGYFIDRRTGVTMHATCFLGGAVAPRPVPAVRPAREPVAVAEPRRLAA